MKGFSIALLCLAAAVQGRNFDAEGLFPSGTEARLGENPWVVHLRVTKSTGGGRLNSCVGSLIGSSWILTAASCLENARFVWIRFGTLDPLRPELVLETSLVTINPGYNAATGENNIALVNINRTVEATDNIKPIALARHEAGAEPPYQGRFCAYSGRYDDPREILQCFRANLDYLDDGSGTIVADEMGSSRYKFEHGSPLVSDGVQIGVLTELTERWSDGKKIKTLRALPLLLPIKNIVMKKKQQWRPSRLEAKDSLFQYLKSAAEVLPTNLRNKENCFQRGLPLGPQLFAVSPDEDNITECFLIIDDTMYNIDSPLKAFDIFFKLFHALHCCYPKQTERELYFLQRAVYNIQCHSDKQIRNSNTEGLINEYNRYRVRAQ